MNTADYLAGCIRPAWRAPFRGEIYEYARKLSLGEGYAVKGPVRMETLRHLVAPLKAIRKPEVRVVSIMGAVQTTKSLTADVVVPYWIEHDPGDTLWLLEDDAKARAYAERALGLIRSVPEISALLEDVDRSDNTKTCLRFRHMKVLICGLNPGNVQSLSWRYVIVDETWLHPFDGLIRQAMDRTKQYPDTCKVLLLGQGGYEGDDHEREAKECQQWELHYACPTCGRYQPFDQSRQRPDDFPRADLRGTYAGLGWDTNETTKPNGRWNLEEVSKTAHHRCYYCDHRIEDRPEVRRQLNDTYRYFEGPAPEGAGVQLPEDVNYKFASRVAFHWPGEASMRVKFGYLARKYLAAKVAAEEQSYKLPMQEYYQKDRGLPWSEVMEGEYREVVREVYDPREAWKEESYKTLIIDCQRDLKKFFFAVFGISLNGEARELERGIAGSFKDLETIQGNHKVKDQHVFLDCGYNMTQVLREAVQHGHTGLMKVGSRMVKVYLCWTGLKGSSQELWAHKHPKTGALEYRIYSPRKFYDTNVGTKMRSPRSPWYEWSNLHCKDLLRSRRDGDPGTPKWLTLPDNLPPTDQASYFAQMRSERRIEQYGGGKKRAIYLPTSKTRPNHYWDIGAMCMAFMAIVGIIGSTQSSEGGGETAGE